MRSRLAFALLAACLFCVANASAAAESRIALVIGESAYEGKAIETAANDAGLIAQTLQAAGFDVSGARDLDEGALRGSLRSRRRATSDPTASPSSISRAPARSNSDAFLNRFSGDTPKPSLTDKE